MGFPTPIRVSSLYLQGPALGNFWNSWSNRGEGGGGLRDVCQKGQTFLTFLFWIYIKGFCRELCPRTRWHILFDKVQSRVCSSAQQLVQIYDWNEFLILSYHHINLKSLKKQNKVQRMQRGIRAHSRLSKYKFCACPLAYPVPISRCGQQYL